MKATDEQMLKEDVGIIPTERYTVYNHEGWVLYQSVKRKRAVEWAQEHTDVAVLVQDEKKSHVLWVIPDTARQPPGLDLDRILAWANLPKPGRLLARILSGERLTASFGRYKWVAELVAGSQTVVRVFNANHEAATGKYLYPKPDRYKVVYDTTNLGRRQRISHRFWRWLKKGAQLSWDQQQSKTGSGQSGVA